MIGEMNQVVLISDDPEARLHFNEVAFPPFGIVGLEEGIENTMTSLEYIREKLINLQAKKHILHDALEERIRRFDVRNVQYGGMTIEDQVRCWKGYIPEPSVEAFVEAAEANSWGYRIEDPTKDDLEEVPTLIQPAGLSVSAL